MGQIINVLDRHHSSEVVCKTDEFGGWQWVLRLTHASQMYNNVYKPMQIERFFSYGIIPQNEIKITITLKKGRCGL